MVAGHAHCQRLRVREAGRHLVSGQELTGLWRTRDEPPQVLGSQTLPIESRVSMKNNTSPGLWEQLTTWDLRTRSFGLSWLQNLDQGSRMAVTNTLARA